MICRIWRGWTTAANADAYEQIVRRDVIPGIEAKAIAGFRRIDLMRRPLANEDRVEFVTSMWFDNLDVVKAFTGEDYEQSYVPASARAVLADFDQRAAHYDILEERLQTTVEHQAVAALQLPDDAALLVIDVQQGFEDPDWGDRNNLGAEDNIARLIAAWRCSGRPIHHVHHASQSPQGKFRAGTPGHSVKPQARPVAGEPVHIKSVNSGFIGTDLERQLRQAGIETLVIVGLTTNHCVSTTTRMAGNLGFHTYLVEDATATFARNGMDGRLRPASEVHSAALGDLADEFATIVSTSTVLAAVERADQVSA